MTPALPQFVLDANVFIQAHRKHYAFELCPGFWASLLHHEQANRVLSIDRVRKELLDGDKDALEFWVNSKAPKSFFASTQTAGVARDFAAMMQWVQGHPQFKSEAKTEFAHKADGWLVAYARATGCTVVTHEEFSPDVKRKVPIPNVCRQFGVPHTDTFSMLKSLKVRFDWKAD
ncbi:MAG: DUF4411 family protein [Gammaproteobacteria bacterium]|nr:DUF4411 family protein [Gammaproteobacteria bacterium]